jgi:hypothetical protein
VVGIIRLILFGAFILMGRAMYPNDLIISPYWQTNGCRKHPTTGGTIYVGSQTAAQDMRLLVSNSITHVVNCTDSMPFYHESRGIVYYRFDVSSWSRYVKSSPESVLAFADPMFQFIDRALEAGSSVLVHCLAGAHRAGTTGCACLMHYANIDDHRTAIMVAKRCRSIIDPIGMLPDFLRRLEVALAWRKNASTGVRVSGPIPIAATQTAAD